MIDRTQKKELSQELLYHLDDMEMLKQLLLNGADINYQNEKGWSLLFEAISSGDSMVFMQVMELGADLTQRDAKGRNALFWVIYYEHPHLLGLLDDMGFDFHEDVYPGLPALHYATFKEDVLTVSKLLKMKLSINMPDKNGSTPIMIAAIYKRINMIQFLCSHGANIYQTDNQGESALTLAKANRLEKYFQPYLKGIK